MPRPFLPFLFLAALAAPAGATLAPTAEGTVYRTVTRTYHTDSYYLKGLLKRELTADAATRPYLETEQTYLLKDVTTGGAGDAASTTATLFPALTRTDNRFFEGQPVFGKATHTLHDYDTLGNVVRFFDAGDSGAGDDVEAYITYSTFDPGCVSRHIVGVAPFGSDTISMSDLDICWHKRR
jgi:hypothetical protein